MSEVVLENGGVQHKCYHLQPFSTLKVLRFILHFQVDGKTLLSYTKRIE